MIAYIGYAFCTEQNFSAGGENYVWYYKSVHRKKLLKYLIYHAFQDRIGNRNRYTRNKYITMLGHDISSCALYRKSKRTRMLLWTATLTVNSV